MTEFILLVIACVIAGVSAYVVLLRVIKVDSVLDITDNPGPRKVHRRKIPTLGGVAIFAGFSMGFLLTGNHNLEGLPYFFAVLLILFFTGIKDDLTNMTPYKKLTIEISAAIIIALLGNIRFADFHGFMGIYEVPVWLSVTITVFLVMVIINSFNLIDGIDGLAASTGIISSAVLGISFYLNGFYGYAFIGASLIGALAVYLFFNISNGKNKIFMGDSGSLFIGFILSVLVIQFNNVNPAFDPLFKLKSTPAISIAILIVPLFDTLRVFVIRISHGQSPFKADKRHIHHLMIQAGFNHKQSTLLISLTHISIIIIAYLLDGLGIMLLSLVLLTICLALTAILRYAIRNKVEKVRLNNTEYLDEPKVLRIKKMYSEDIAKKDYAKVD